MMVEREGQGEEAVEGVVQILRRLLTQARKDKVTGKLTLEIDLRDGGVARKHSIKEVSDSYCSAKVCKQEK